MVRTKSNKNFKSIQNETQKEFFKQILLPLLIAGFGMAYTGIMFDYMKTSQIFQNVPQIIILLPALLGLKGNLEMTMTSRLSTFANNGGSMKTLNSLFVSNLALTKCQSIIIGFAASLFTLMINFISNERFMSQPLMLCTTSTFTALLTSTILSKLMTKVIECSIKYRINPDNIATPIAAALGDFLSLVILYCLSKLFFHLNESKWWWLQLIKLILVFSWIPKLISKAFAHESTASALSINSWIPLLMAMLLSNLSGYILSKSVIYFNQISSFQPLINGVGGNIAAIQASRLSSFVHSIRMKNKNNKQELKKFIDTNCNRNPFSFLFKKNVHAKTIRTLLLVVMPFHLIFFFFLNNQTQQPIMDVHLFLIFYLLSTLIQVFLLLYITGLLVKLSLTFKMDPDNLIIPYITGFGDLFGTLFLTIAFIFYRYFLPI